MFRGWNQPPHLIMRMTILLTSLGLLLSPNLSAADYNAVDDMGVRVFSEVPEVGVHPRVLMSPGDLPGWRENVIKSDRGKTFFAKRYESKVIKQLAAIGPDVAGKDLLAAYSDKGPGNNHHLLFATMDVIYHDDREQAAVVCRAVANFARVILARSQHDPEWGQMTKDIGDITGLNGIPAGLGHLWMRGGADFALAYDYLYNDMTPAQRSICRKALSVAVKDLVTWGMGFPKGRAVSNWYAYHGELGPMLLAIEEEDGYNARGWETFKTAIRNWAVVQIYDTGGANEDGYVGNLALREGQFTLIAMARRGENLYRTPALQNYWKWAVLSLVPGEETGETVGYSSCRLAPYESSPVLARWAMPGNPWLNYYFRQFKGDDYERNKRWQYAQMSTLFGMNWEDTEELPLDPAKLGLPLTEVFDYQGLFIARSDWLDDAAYLNMLARHDAWYDRHENVDRGRFVFAALGRQWAVDLPWGAATKSDDHSLVHIDGKAQAEAKVGRGKAPNAKLIEHGDLGNPAMGSYGVMDLSNAYNWLWAHSWSSPGEGWEPETRSFEELGWPWKRPGQPPALHGHDDESAPKYNFKGCNLWRKSNNPVEYCWRTGVLARGAKPYAIIIDDVRKDGEKHVYEWYMPIADDLEMEPLESGPPGACLLVEKEAKETGTGSRRLLVVPTGGGTPMVRVEEYVASKPRGKEFVTRRLVVSRSGVEGRFRVVLYPFRMTEATGMKLPEIRPTATGLRVGNDEWLITPGNDGRSRVRMKRW